MRLYSPLLLRWAHLEGFDGVDAEDITQTVLVKLLRLLPTYERQDRHSFRGWLFTICRNEARDFRTRRATRPLPDADGLSTVAAPPSTRDPDADEYHRILVLATGQKIVCASRNHGRASHVHLVGFPGAEYFSNLPAQDSGNNPVRRGHMRQILRNLAPRLFGRSKSTADAVLRMPSESNADEFQRLLAAKIRELDELRAAKDQELQAVWEHAHKLDRALQQLHEHVQATKEAGDGTPGRQYEILAHSFGATLPEIPSVIVPDFVPNERDVRIAGRLLRAYHRAAAEEGRRSLAPEGDCWAWIKTLQRDFFRILAGNDPAALAGYLCNMGRRDATIGVDQGNLEYDKFCSDPKYCALFALRFKDKLVSLAEAVGAIPCENPEQGSWGRSLHANADSLVEAISRVLGMDITPPPIDGGLLKIVTNRGLFCERDCQALFTAWCLREVFGSLDGMSLCEIGAGSGRVPYWSRRMGCTSYTVFDLPHINVVQGFYLLKALSEDRVFLYGECNPSERNEGITILPYFCTSEMPPQRFDLVLNQDSFPEVQPEVVRGYLEWIKTASRRYFYSLNHESKPLTIGGGSRQLSVPELVAEVGGYKRLSRVPYWLRRGYVAELYSVEPVSE